MFNVIRGSRFFSTSLPKLASTKSAKYTKALERRKANIAKQNKIQGSTYQVDPVLGRKDTPFIDRVKAEVQEKNVYSQGYNKEDVDKLIYGSQQSLLRKNYAFSETEIVQKENKKREIVSRILNMKNASKPYQRKLAIEIARKEFQRFEGDTGSSEVQAAVMTIRIHYLYDHIKKNFKDLANIRKLRMLVQQRQSILRYLKRDNPERYYWAITKLGLTDEVVAMEFNMDRRYLQQFKVFGDKVLVKESKRVAEEKRKEIQKHKRAERVAQAQAENAKKLKSETSVPEIDLPSV